MQSKTSGSGQRDDRDRRDCGCRGPRCRSENMERQGPSGLEGRSPYVRKLQKEAAIIAGRVLANDMPTISEMLKDVDRKEIDHVKSIERCISPGGNLGSMVHALSHLENMKPSLSIPALAEAVGYDDMDLRRYASQALGRIAEEAYKNGDTTAVALLLPTAIKLTDAIDEIKKMEKRGKYEDQILETMNESLDIIVYGERKPKKEQIL